jgi:hypothetical protein
MTAVEEKLIYGSSPHFRRPAQHFLHGIGRSRSTLSPRPFPKVGATPDVRSLMRQHIRKTPEKSADLCPFPFPFQTWFDGDAVRARSGSWRKRGGG